MKDNLILGYSLIFIMDIILIVLAINGDLSTSGYIVMVSTPLLIILDLKSRQSKLFKVIYLLSFLFMLFLCFITK